MEVEKWKTIEGYPDYQVSNMGRVKSLKYGNERILKPNKTKYGYLQVKLCNYVKKKDVLVHRLVAYAFVQNESLFNTEINHLDENKENNCASNLEWTDRKYNCNYGTRIERVSKAISTPVKCLETGVVYASTRDIERQLGFLHNSISQCCRGRYKQAYGYHWKYVE